MRYYILFISAAAALLTAPPTPAPAALVVYTDLASFEAATTGLADVNFNGIAPPGSFVSFPTPPGFTRSGVTFDIANALPGDALNVTARDFYAPTTYPNDFLVPSVSPLGRPTTVESVTLPSGATAVGFDLGTFKGGAVTFSFPTGDQYVDANPATFGHTSFLGFTSSEPVPSLTFSYTATMTDTVVIEGFRFGQGTAPEPGTFALAAVGGFLSFVVGLASRKGTCPSGSPLSVHKGMFLAAGVSRFGR